MGDQVTARQREAGLADAELLAWLLDNSIPIPGTGRRVGLDALIGLVPGLGDILSGGLGILIIARGIQRGLPPIVLARMFANVALDFVVGAIPVIGDAFDFWYKANARNVGLLRRYSEVPSASTAAEWGFFVAVLAIIGVVAAGTVWLIWSILGALFG